MAELLIDAIINEGSGGAYYKVKLRTVPCVGEQIELTSFADIESGHSNGSLKKYTVAAVRHEVYDVTEKNPKGMHEIEILVK